VNTPANCLLLDRRNREMYDDRLVTAVLVL
jgi:hypothetical protein